MVFRPKWALFKCAITPCGKPAHWNQRKLTRIIPESYNQETKSYIVTGASKQTASRELTVTKKLGSRTQVQANMMPAEGSCIQETGS